MFSRLLVLFIVIPAVELYLLIQMGQWIGGLETLGVIVLTGIVGSFLAKSQGLATWFALQRKLAAGQAPGREVMNGIIILFSGALLLTPGILTDLAGLAGLFPPTRRFIRSFLLRRVESWSRNGLVRGSVSVSGPSASGPMNDRFDRWDRKESDTTHGMRDPEISGSAKHTPGSTR